MDSKRIGYCTNFGNCKNADNRIPIEVDISADFVCPEPGCERNLTEIPPKMKILKKYKKPLIAVIAILMLALGAYFGIMKLIRHSSVGDIKTGITVTTDSDSVYNKIGNPVESTSVAVSDTSKIGVKIQDIKNLTDTTGIAPPAKQSIQITVQPKDISTCVGKNKVNFIVSATGKGHLKYQWRFNGTDISQENTSILKFNQVISEDGGNYDVKISDQNGSSVISNQASLKISTNGQPPRILSQPKDYSICSGNSNIILSVEASGAQPLFYQWRFNGKDLPDNIGSSISLINVNQSKTGNYDVIVSNQCGSITSKAARIFMPVAPHITSAPKDLNVEEGRTVVFNVSASGSSSLKYNWYLNSNQISNVGSKLQIAAFNQNNSGSYKIIVNDECGRKDEATFYVDIKSSFSSRYQKAVDLYDSHQYDNAEIRFSSLLRERPADPFVNYMLGLCRVAVGNYDNATSEYFKQVITLKDYISNSKSCEMLCKAKYYIAMCSYQQNNVPLKNIKRNFEDFVKYPCGCSSQKTEYDNANNILNHIGN